METKDAVHSLNALAQEHRLRIFRLLVEQGPEGLPAGKISEELGTAAATASFHLKELAQAGLITAQQEGRFIFYSANFKAMNALIAFLTENCCAKSGSCSGLNTPKAC